MWNRAAILDAPDIQTARLLKDNFVEEYAERVPKAVQVLEDGFDDITAVLALPDRQADATEYGGVLEMASGATEIPGR
ncbi:MAG: transposase [Alicyclobacillus sp.]|nr:transposase [Alicyclobacillus sp.]